MSQRIFRFQVPVDGEWYAFDLNGPVVHVAARTEDIVEFWTVYDDVDPVTTDRSQSFKVLATGQLIPTDAKYVGTAVTPSGRLVWHLVQQVGDAA